MGCCESTDSKANLQNYSKKIKEILDTGSISSLNLALKYITKKSPKIEPPIIDCEIACINKISLNPLAYCLFLGNLSLFKFLLDKGASLKVMDTLLEKSCIRAINIICYKGHLDLLEYYLPIFLNNYKSGSAVYKSFTIDLKDTIITRYEYDLAIHSACRAGMVQIVSFLLKYFENFRNCPVEFNIHAVDEAYGEDAGLIACRSGCFALVKLLHETYKMDFKQLNANGENAVMVCVAGYNKCPNYTFLECLEYLFQVVGLDVTYMHEELLVVAEGKDVVKIIEKELEKKGIFKKKKDFVKAYVRRKVQENSADNEAGIIFTKEDLEFMKTKNLSIISSIKASNGGISTTSFLSNNLE